MKRRACALLAAALLLVGCAGQAKEEKHTVVGFFFDTVVTLTAYTDDKAALDAALEACARYEALLSKTAQGSDVWNLNHAGGKSVKVSRETLEILEIAREVGRLSDGAFDVTIAPAVALWDFKAPSPVLPGASALSEAASRVDYTRVQVQGDSVTLPGGMELDLGGVAKGYIADAVAGQMREAGVEHAILNFGGNVIAVGDKPGGAVWQVGIQDPKQPTGDYLLRVSARDIAVVTSGIYERGFDLEGVRYHHILDPKTGWPVQNELAGVTIFCAQSGWADALSTAAFALGLERGKALIEGLEGVEALFITRADEVVATEGAQALINS